MNYAGVSGAALLLPFPKRMPNETVPGMTPPPQHGVQPLPDGYVANPDLGFAYKRHGERLTWMQAINVCRQEGAQVAVVDANEKRQYLRSLTSDRWLQAGIIRYYLGGPWVNVNTGEPVLALTWGRGEPTTGHCTAFGSTVPELAGNSCTYGLGFYCEIPIRLRM